MFVQLSLPVTVCSALLQCLLVERCTYVGLPPHLCFFLGAHTHNPVDKESSLDSGVCEHACRAVRYVVCFRCACTLHAVYVCALADHSAGGSHELSPPLVQTHRQTDTHTRARTHTYGHVYVHTHTHTHVQTCTCTHKISVIKYAHIV